MTDLAAFLPLLTAVGTVVGTVYHGLALRDRWRGARRTPPDTR